MVATVEPAKQVLDADYSSARQLLKAVVNSRDSFLGDVVPHILYEASIVDFAICGKPFLDGSDFLSGEENSKRVEKQVEGMLRHEASVILVIFDHLGVALVQVVDSFAEQLEFELVIDFLDLIHPVHLFI